MKNNREETSIHLKTLDIQMSPEDFDFTKFGGNDEIKTTINEEQLEEFITCQWWTYESISITFNWKYFLIMDKPIDRLFHLMTLNQALSIVHRLIISYVKNTTFIVRVPYVWGSQQDKITDDQNRVDELYLIPNYVSIYETIIPHSTTPFHSNPFGDNSEQTARLSTNASRKWVDKIMSMFDDENTIYIYPDASAFERYSYYGMKAKNYIILGKERDINTGKLIPQSNSTKFITKDIQPIYENLVMLDDMIMGGGTFLMALEYINKNKITMGVKNIIVAPQITPEIYGHVFDNGVDSFDTVITMDNNYHITHPQQKTKTTLIKWEDIYMNKEYELCSICGGKIFNDGGDGCDSSYCDTKNILKPKQTTNNKQEKEKENE